MTQPVNPGTAYQNMYYNGTAAPQAYPAYQYQTNATDPKYMELQKEQLLKYESDPAESTNKIQPWFDYKNDRWIKGAIVGAAAAVLLTNTTVQKTVAKGVLSLWGMMQSGVEEFKEQIRDAQAEKSEE